MHNILHTNKFNWRQNKNVIRYVFSNNSWLAANPTHLKMQITSCLQIIQCHSFFRFHNLFKRLHLAFILGHTNHLVTCKAAIFVVITFLINYDLQQICHL